MPNVMTHVNKIYRMRRNLLVSLQNFSQSWYFTDPCNNGSEEMTQYERQMSLNYVNRY